MTTSPIKFEAELGVSGHYAFYKNGEYVADSDNILTDGFFLRFNAGLVGQFGYCFLGASNIEPTINDTGIGSFLGGGLGYFNTTYTAPFKSDGGSFFKLTQSYVFKYFAGTCVGTVREAGVRMSHAGDVINLDLTGGVIDSHVLVRDLTGNPSEIVLGVNDSLVVVFSFSAYLPVKPLSVWQVIAGNNHLVSYHHKGYDSINLATVATYDGDGVNLSWDPSFFNDFYYSYGVSVDVGIVEDYHGSTSNYSLALTPGRYDNGASHVYFLSSYSVDHREIIHTFTDIPGGYFEQGLMKLSWATQNNFFQSVHRELVFEPVLTRVAAGIIAFTIRYYTKRHYSGDLPNPALAIECYPQASSEVAVNGAFTTAAHAGYGRASQWMPYTYAWTWKSGGTVFSCDSPLTQTTTFSATASESTTSEIWTCTVTDTQGATASADILLDYSWTASV